MTRLHRSIKDLSDEARSAIIHDFHAGVSIPRLSKLHDIADEALRRMLVPGYAARRDAAVRMARRARERGGLSIKALRTAEPIEVKHDADRLKTRIPPDTRSLTGRLCGDPIPNDPRRQR